MDHGCLPCSANCPPLSRFVRKRKCRKYVTWTRSWRHQRFVFEIEMVIVSFQIKQRINNEANMKTAFFLKSHHLHGEFRIFYINNTASSLDHIFFLNSYIWKSCWKFTPTCFTFTCITNTNIVTNAALSRLRVP